MHKRNPLRSLTAGLAASLIITIFASGCNLFGPRTQTRPNPTRPSRTTPGARTPGSRTSTPLRPSPTKRLPGVSAVNVSTLRTSVDRIRTAVSKNDWAAATRETNSLGGMWTRFKPTRTGMSATEMKNFDANYAKLQKDVRMKNKANAERDIRALRDSVMKMK